MKKIDIIKKLEKEKRVEGVYVFGSSINGKETELSDIDICVFGDFSSQEKSKIERMFSEVYDVSFFNDLPIWIKIRVFKEGKCLFFNNKSNLYSVVFSTLREYEDFKPLIMKRIKERFGKCTI